MKSKNTKNDGIIIILSYPDTVVRPAYREFSSKIWPKIGIGSTHAVQAGHAALLLIKKNEPKIQYFDFGRYITTNGYGRTRSAETDPELFISVEAKFKDNILINIEEILLWIEKHPEKTHGSGRLVAGINEYINYKKALQFIHNLINQKELPYGAFIKKGTNCARFVTDTIIASTTQKSIKKSLKNSNLFTPSPIGNVIKATSSENIFQIHKQKTTLYTNRSILKEYKASFFNKFDTELNLIGTEIPDRENFELKNGTWLGGIGSGAWFTIESKLNAKTYLIARYSVTGTKEFDANFYIENDSFDIQKPFKFKHPSNFKEIQILQDKKLFTFKPLKTKT